MPHTYSYKVKCPVTVRKCVVACWWIQYMGKLHHPWTCIQRWQKLMPTSFVLDQDSEKSRSTEERREEQTKKCPSDYIPLVMSSESQLHHFLYVRALVFNLCLSLLLNSSSIRAAIQYYTRRLFHLGKGLSYNCHHGRASAHDLASIWASAAGIGCICPLDMSMI